MNNIDSIRNELDILTKIIAETIPVEQIYLFGSYAYGIPHKDSDLDLYIVLKDETPIREMEAIEAVGLAIYKKQNHAIDLLVHKKSKFLDRSTGITTIERIVSTKGIKIYG
ncbi:nucleotidyltransferase domain-containing protein [Leadbettera azotonutricia]|uniref:Nucleotidyltransferase domain protein n=1 Tax=Leadbettera azotonutricia (strain ATCC BAA-888 / DSM 13862 / ZAS-9) TaxID=545695 RepID=F5YCY3_LEAAZ|nr:nucleotidyltransferase domain-containing protein [Leadbettera azotonutricia]AEF81233.1 nucleotidyltransferase domain protein [Leadbettera azotonutricia ZAS-9]